MKDKHSEDLKHIRSMMEQGSRFISLSGISGVFAGIIALLTAFIAYKILDYHHIAYYDVPNIETQEVVFIQLGILAALSLLLCLSIGVVFTVRKSKKNNLKIWTKSTFNLIENLAIPLVAGGIVCLAFLYWNDIYYIAPATLVFYGLALINASKYTFGDVKYLGVCELILGLIAFFFLGKGLFFWAIGFGVLHIIYGLIMYRKYQ